MGVRALPEGLVRVTDIARFLGVSRQRADQLVDTSVFPAPATRIGSSRYWRREDLEDWVLEVEWWTRTRTPGRRRTPSGIA